MEIIKGFNMVNGIEFSYYEDILRNEIVNYDPLRDWTSKFIKTENEYKKIENKVIDYLNTQQKTPKDLGLQALTPSSEISNTIKGMGKYFKADNDNDNNYQPKQMRSMKYIKF